MNVNELIKQCEQRREEILSKLPPDLKRELGELETVIRRTRSLIDAAKNSKVVSRNGVASHGTNVTPSPPAVEAVELGTVTVTATNHQEENARQRISLSQRKKGLIEFLKTHGRMRRTTIQKETGIPNGSLSQLLQEPEFEKDEENLWRVKEE